MLYIGGAIALAIVCWWIRMMQRANFPKEVVTVEDLLWLGKRVPKPPPDLLSDHYLIRGCQSKTWLRVNPNGSVDIWADSLLVRGLTSFVTSQGTIGDIPALSLPRVAGLKSILTSLHDQRLSIKSLV